MNSLLKAASYRWNESFWRLEPHSRIPNGLADAGTPVLSFWRPPPDTVSESPRLEVLKALRFRSAKGPSLSLPNAQDVSQDRVLGK